MPPKALPQLQRDLLGERGGRKVRCVFRVAYIWYATVIVMMILTIWSTISWNIDTERISLSSQPSRNNNDNKKGVHQPPSIPGVPGQPCRYNGHCGVGTTCAVDKSSYPSSSMMPGSCQPYMSNNITKTSLATSLCARQCLAGLESNVLMQQIWKSDGVQGRSSRPNACVVQFRRVPGYARPDYDEQVYQTSFQQHRVVRVDPILDPEFHEEWVAVCYEPCETSSCGEGFVCRESRCQRDESYWQTPSSSSSSSNHDMIIVSGTNDQYFDALRNLAGSIRYWAPNHKLVVYNLGMSKENLETLKKWVNVLDIKWKDGIPDHYPRHLHSLKAYAWKPVAINESLHEYKQIFWLDAGSTVAGPITEAIRITQESGIFLVKGQDSDMKGMSHPGTYETFGYDKASFRAGPHYSGNTQAYLYPSRYVNTVVIPNAQCALQKSCIMPEGSSLANHRYDQTSLSVLAYRDDLSIPHYTMFLAAGRDQLANDLKQPSKMFVWTSRGQCHDFHEFVQGIDPFS
jgi:Protein of unknown function (DUF1647)